MLEQILYCHVPVSHLEKAIKWYKESYTLNLFGIVKRKDKHN
ncbi:hypothetical protein J32TS2_42050 [Shouchella clausii]|nr:hypothetical protein J32TS2_42050 [Shouchella clausii]